MMRSTIYGFTTRFWVAAAVLALLYTVSLVLAQEGGRRREAPALKSDERQRLRALSIGKAEVGASDKGLLANAAKWLVNRLTWKEYQLKEYGENGQQDRTTINDILKQAFLEIPVPAPGASLTDNQRSFLKEFSKPLVVEIKQVLQNEAYIARINAARILARLGQAGVEEAADAFVDVLNDKKQIEAVKLFALKGLKELFALAPLNSKERESRCIAALLAYVNQKPDLPHRAAAAEIDGYRYVRREAVRALGQTRLPAARDSAPPTNRTAEVLLRVMRKQGFTPEPSLAEQIEAAIGVCQLQSSLYREYQVDYAMYQIGLFVLDFANAYNDDLAKNADKPKAQGWKYQAARLVQALDKVKTDTREKDKYVLSLVDALTTFLLDVDGSKTLDANNIAEWVGKHPPPPDKNTIYQGDEKSVIKSPAGTSK